jgi:hypothetical protein
MLPRPLAPRAITVSTPTPLLILLLTHHLLADRITRRKHLLETDSNHECLLHQHVVIVASEQGKAREGNYERRSSRTLAMIALTSFFTGAATVGFKMALLA